MVYIIIFITIAAALGPLLSVLPSKHQRAVADFRERARKAGVLVQLREPKNSRRLDVAIRGLEPELWVRSKVGWESRSGDPVSAVITAVTEHIEVIFLSDEDIQVFWDERGGEGAYCQVEKLIESGVAGSLKAD